ncbi:MAG: TPM domain-containing protein [Desulfuromonadales bacterium]|nr:TPM domain-containing protein [Desulfuromonadales bacterium]
MTKLLGSLLILLLACTSVAALGIPKTTGYINDTAGLISSGVETKLEKFLHDFEKSDSTQITVLTIPTLDGAALEEYSLQVFEAWKLGQQGKDNGALLLIAKAERKVRIEVGYGLEGRLTDLMAGRIIDNEITPQFKKGDFDSGIVAGIIGIAEAVRGEYAGSGKTSGKKKRSSFGSFFFLLFFILPLIGRLGGSRRGHYRRSGIFFGGPFIGGGGFGGGGGGGFSGGGGFGGGGGASGGW